MAHQQPHSPRQWGSSQSRPSDPFNPPTPGRSRSNDSGSGAQYVDYPTHLSNSNAPQVRSAGPPTPMHHEDTRLLVSQPSSPIPADFSVALPPQQHQQASGAHQLQGQHQQQMMQGRNNGGGGGGAPMRQGSAHSFTSSPLNPASPPTHPSSYLQQTSPFPALASSSSSSTAVNPFSRVPSLSASASQPLSLSRPGSNRNGSFLPSSPGSPGHTQAAEDGVIATLGLGINTSGFPSSMGQGSMVLYRLASEPSSSLSSRDPLLLPPRLPFPPGKSNRDSFASSSGDSIVSLAESKYPATVGTGTMSSVRGLVPYAYDPAVDENEPPDEEDLLHDPNPNAHLSSKYRAVVNSPSEKGSRSRSDSNSNSGRRSGGSGSGGSRNKKAMMNWDEGTGGFGWRGVFNIGMLALLILGLLSLFVFYPVFTFYRDQKFNEAVEGNIRINATGQAPVLFQMPEQIDIETPDSAKSRTGYDGQAYELVFSDEFNTPGRTFYPGDDPFWEAVDLWYGSTGDLEWYDPQQVTTRDGALVITMDSTSTTQAGLTPNSTAPFTDADNHGLDYRSGMLQSWNKFCFTTGYIEVSVTFPGPDQNTQGYWPGAWTMGNLARPGYSATTDGMWPYTYDSCDVGTFPNQTLKDGSGPAAALHSDASRDKYNFDLSWLTGQRVSACSCPGSDHPGPSVSVGRGAPEIDIFETEKDKVNPVGQVVSQSAQFAPFTHDYDYNNDSSSWQVYNSLTRANTYKGSAVQQAISGLTTTPTDIFQGSGDNFHTFGFEYWSDPKNRNDGFITWQADGQKTYQIWASAVAPDQGADGTGVGQRLIPEEPMSIVLNLGISPSWQTINLASMTFPAEMKVDYVRVYQRKGQTNTGCNPSNYPTTDYINAHMEAFTNVNLTTWPYQKPKNSMYDGC